MGARPSCAARGRASSAIIKRFYLSLHQMTSAGLPSPAGRGTRSCREISRWCPRGAVEIEALRERMPSTRYMQNHARIFSDRIEENGLAKLGGSLAQDRNSLRFEPLKIGRKLTAHCRLTVSDCARSYIRLIAAITASVAASLIRECIGSCTHSAAAASVTGRCAPIDRYGASKCDALTEGRHGRHAADRLAAETAADGAV